MYLTYVERCRSQLTADVLTSEWRGSTRLCVSTLASKLGHDGDTQSSESQSSSSLIQFES